MLVIPYHLAVFRVFPLAPAGVQAAGRLPIPFHEEKRALDYFHATLSRPIAGPLVGEQFHS